MDDDLTSITFAGVIFLVYLAVMVMLYFLLGPAVDAMFDAFTGNSFGYANSQMNYFVPLFRSATKIAFAFGLATPIAWFIFWVFSREPAYSRYRF